MSLSQVQLQLPVKKEFPYPSSIDFFLNNDFIIQKIIQEANQKQIPVKDLVIKTFLHLPRIIRSPLFNKEEFEVEICRLALLISTNYSEVQSSVPNFDKDFSQKFLEDFYVSRLAEEEKIFSNQMIGKMHYLNSIRENSLDIALRYKHGNCIVGIISISDFDLHHLDTFPCPPDKVKVISRIYTKENLPKNTPSRFIALTKKWIRENLPGTELLLTYLNPNVGFKGAIYQATNWIEYAHELNVRYAYFKKDYVTDRFLQKNFSSMFPDSISPHPTIEFSSIILHPLKILACNPRNSIMKREPTRKVLAKRT